MVGRGAVGHLTALSLAQAGVRSVTLFQQGASAEGPVNLTPNAMHVLNALGCGAEVVSGSYAPLAEHLRTGRTGYLLSQRPLGAFAQDRYGAPHICATEATLAELAKRATAATDIAVEEAQVVDVEPAQGSVVTASGAEARFDLVVGADGPASLVRERAVASLERQATNLPARLHRRAATGARFPDMAITHWLGPGGYAWQMPTLDCIWTLTIGDCAAACPVLDAGHEISSQPIELSKPLTSWSTGRVTLVGCAAHPIMPTALQATALALEDAWVLARMVESYDDHLPTALEEYERYRAPRARRMQRHAQTLLARRTARGSAALRHNLTLAFGSRFMPEPVMQREDWLYRYDCVRGFR